MELKLLMVYNIKPHKEAEYYRYVLGEFLPELQSMGLYMSEGWHTAYGDYPVRQIGFRVDGDADIRAIVNSPDWDAAKEKLFRFVRDYEERLVPASNMFQFFIPKKE